MPDKIYDVIIIGGSAAGLSAAMTLGRSLRNILIIDSGTPCNIQSPRSHNFITQDGKTPAEIVELAKDQVLKYTTTDFLQDKVTTAGKNGVFHVETETGKQFRTQKILLSTGLADMTPDIPGFSDCWGISILHCPYCHGYEMKDENTVILANGQAAFNTGMLIHNWTKNLTILTNGVSELRHKEREKLEKLGIHIIEKEISGISHVSGSLDKINFKDGSHFTAKAMYATIPFHQQSDLGEMLGCQLTEHGHIVINDDQMTTVEGVYAAGDNTAQHRAISVASASGTKAGFAINMALTSN
jgi:thioredoxin reductase